MRAARWLVAIAVLTVLPPLLPSFLVVVRTEIAIVARFATAFNLLMGFGGMVSFGHAAYFALGAYAAAILVKQAGWPMLLGLAAAPFAAAAGALVFGFFIVRLTHTYFAMLSLAFAQIVFTVIFKWKTLTGGDDGLLNVWPPAWLKSPLAYGYFTLAVTGLAILAMHAIVDSPFGYALRSCWWWWRCRRGSWDFCRGERGGRRRRASPAGRRPPEALRGRPGRQRRRSGGHRGRAARDHRPQRRRQDHAVQLDQRGSATRLGPDLLPRRADQRPHAAGALSPRPGAHVPDHLHLPTPDHAGERSDCAAHPSSSS